MGLPLTRYDFCLGAMDGGVTGLWMGQPQLQVTHPSPIYLRCNFVRCKGDTSTHQMQNLLLVLLILLLISMYSSIVHCPKRASGHMCWVSRHLNSVHVVIEQT